MDDEFLEQVDQARRTRAGLRQPAVPLEASRSRIESALSPREMQTRMRAGRTVAQVAAEAGVPIEWVERFAAPVLAEQAAAVERAQQSTMRTQRRGYSDRALGPSVLRNLADRGIRLADDEFDQMWTAFQLAENEWVIRFKYRFRGRDLDAEWLLDEGAGSLTPGNRQATELGFVDPGRHAPPVKGLPPMRVLRRSAPVVNAPTIVQLESPEPTASPAPPTRTRTAPKGARKTTPAKPATKTAVARTARKRTHSKASKATGAGRAARPARAAKSSGGRNAKKATWKAAPKKAVAKTAAPKKPVAKKTIAKKVVAKKAVVRKPGAKKAVAKKAAAKKAVAKPRRTAGATTPPKTSPSASSSPVRRERPLKAVRAAGNGVHAPVKAGRVAANGRNGSAAAQTRGVTSVSRAGGNGSRRSGG